MRFHQISSDFIRFNQIFFSKKNLWNYFSKGCHLKKWKKKHPQQSQTSRFPFPRVVTQKKRRKKTTAISNLTIPFFKGCDPKELEKKKHTAISNLTIPFLKGFFPKELQEKKTHSNLKPHHSLSQGL